MAESRFIRTVTFGGFDRSDVIRRMEFLNGQIYDLKNELRETKLLMEDFKKGTPEEKSYENVMTVERAKLTEVQVKNETLTAKSKAAAEDIKKKDEEIAALRQNVEELTAKLTEAEGKISAYEAGSDPMAISQVFVQAQMSSNQLIANAKADAEKITADARALVDESVNDANDQASQIIYEAERSAAEKIAEAQNKSEQMDAASNNLRATVLEDVNSLTEKMNSIKSILDEFTSASAGTVEKSQKLLSDTKAVLEEGGVPVFRIPQNIEAELPEPPAAKKPKHDSDKKKILLDGLEGLDTLDELTSQVTATEEKDSTNKPKKVPKISLDSSELDALLKDSEALL